MTNEATIFALATPPGRSAVAIIRLSGQGTQEALNSLCGRLPDPRVATYCELRNPENEEIVDHGLVLFFPAPHSFTGEDCGELQVHGSNAVIQSLLDYLSRLNEFRLAEPGEFAKRAFENNKLDLSQVEGLADLIDAQTSFQHQQALRQIRGGLSDKVQKWRESALSLMVKVEAEIDFSDEGDVGEFLNQGFLRSLDDLYEDVEKYVDNDHIGEKIREGFRVVLTGPTNAGKSTLLNYLAKRDAAIVSHLEGTTRDVIEVDLNIDGYLVTVVDTAGFRETEDEIEIHALSLSQKQIELSDLIIDLYPVGSEKDTRAFPEDYKLLKVRTKIDLSDNLLDYDDDFINISVPDDNGLDELLYRIKSELSGLVIGREHAIVTRQRHREELTNFLKALDRAKVSINDELLELLAEDLRVATHSASRILGSMDVEHILDGIFSTFCIGK